MQVNYKTKRGAILLNRIGEDFKVKVGEGLTTGSFISDILKEHHMTLYHNGAKTFDWAKRYDNLHKLLQSDTVKCFKGNSGPWAFTIAIDSLNKLAFLFVKEPTINRKRKQNNLSEYYISKLLRINDNIRLQQKLIADPKEIPFKILNDLCQEITYDDIPAELNVVVVSFTIYNGEVNKITANLFDRDLMQIDEADWSKYIPLSYPNSTSNNDNTKKQIDDINEEVKKLQEQKCNLTSLKSLKQNSTEPTEADIIPFQDKREQIDLTSLKSQNTNIENTDKN